MIYQHEKLTSKVDFVHGENTYMSEISDPDFMYMCEQ